MLKHETNLLDLSVVFSLSFSFGAWNKKNKATEDEYYIFESFKTSKFTFFVKKKTWKERKYERPSQRQICEA